MRLWLFRGRRWWLVTRKTCTTGRDAAAPPRPRGAPGHHRKTSRRIALAPRDLAAGRTTAPPEANLADVGAARQHTAPSGGASSGASGDSGDASSGGDSGEASSGGESGDASSGGDSGDASSGGASLGAASAGTGAAGSARPAGRAAARVAIKAASGTPVPDLTATLQVSREPARPWYEPKQAGRAAGTVRHCGSLENVLVREWAPGVEPPAEAATAITRLADLPQLVKEKLAASLDAIHVGSGGVPDLDHMARLKGVPLPSGRATWDACAGAYGARKIIVGTRPSPTPDVMCHEVGHALDDIDGTGDRWQSDSPEFHGLYGRCLPYLASEFHRHGGPLGRREFFADSFAAIASSQRPALVQMLTGNTRAALDVMLYFNVRYGM
jgi:hypothetical protein